MNLATTAAFAPEPYMPWLRTDPAMQHYGAFADVEIHTVPEYAPMSHHFPAGTKVIAKRIRRFEDLTEGVYRFQQFVPAGQHSSQDQTTCAFGRFAGLSETCDKRAQARRAKQGKVHFDLSTDVAVENPGDYLLHEDGTRRLLYMNFNDANSTLWQYTHYISLPADALAAAGLSEEITGATQEQARWMREEVAIKNDEAEEYLVQVLGGFPEPDCRAVLYSPLREDFNIICTELPMMSAAQAKRYKKGAVAITWRSIDYLYRPVGDTVYLRLEDAGLLLDLLRAETAQQRSREAVSGAAAAVRTRINEAIAASKAGRLKRAQVLAPLAEAA